MEPIRRGRRPMPEVIALAAGAVVVDSARRALAGGVGPTEERIFRSVNDLSDAANPPLWAVMQTGALGAVFVAAAELERRSRRVEAGCTLAAGVGVWGGVKLVKPLIGRGRPAAELPNVSIRGKPPTGKGYPSGHAAVAATLALATTSTSRRGVRALALAAAATTGMARMYVGAHLPLDVAGGLGIGLLCGCAARRSIRRSGAGSRR